MKTTEYTEYTEKRLPSGGPLNVFSRFCVRTKFFSFSVYSVVLSLFFSLLAHAATTGFGDRILQSELKQQQIRSTTQRVNDQLAAIIDEFQRNGIGGEDVVVLKSIQSVLGKLSDKEMGRIVDLLQEARSVPDPLSARKRLLDADSGQKTVIIKLKQLLDEYRRQQALYDLSIRFAQLSEKENGNMRDAIWLESLVHGKAVDHYTEAEQIPWRQQVINQETIKDEVALAIGRLGELLKQSGEQNLERAKAGREMIQKGNLEKMIEVGLGDLNNGRILSAAGNEKRTRDLLMDVARQLAPPKDVVEALKGALREVEAAIQEQSSVMQLTEQLGKTVQESADVANRQLTLSDKTDSIRQDILSSAPAAATTLKEAALKMQEAHAELNQKEGRYRKLEAKRGEQAAMDKLETARKQLQKQLAKAEEDAKKEQESLARLKELLQTTHALVEEQTQLKTQSAAQEKEKNVLAKTAAPQQAKLKERTQMAQSDAGAVAPQAAKQLAEAANQMDKAEKSLLKEVNAPEAQKAAIAALAGAEGELANAIAKLENSDKEMASLEALSQKLPPLIKRQQDVQMATAKTATQAKPDQAQTAKLSEKQDALGEDTAELAHAVAGVLPPASEPLAEAIINMGDARAQLNMVDPKRATGEQAKAVGNLFASKAAIEERLHNLKRSLKKQENTAANLAQAAAKIEKAQEELSQAMSQLAPAAQKSEPESAAAQAAAKNLENAANLATEAALAANLPTPAQAAIQDAQQMLTHATAEATAGKAKPAQSSAGQAHAALAQASAILEMAQAGMPTQAVAQNQEGQPKPGEAGQDGPEMPDQPGTNGQEAPKTDKPADATAQAQKSNENADGGSEGKEGNWNAKGGADGQRQQQAKGGSAFLGLPQRDREAIQQSQAEKYPQEYGPMVEQYLKNLAEESAPKK